MKAGFILYIDQYAPIAHLSSEQKGKLLDAFFAFNMGQEIFFDDPVLRMAFAFFRQAFERDAEAYARKCQKNRDNVKMRYAKATSVDAGMPLHRAATNITQPHNNPAQDKDFTPLPPLQEGGGRASVLTHGAAAAPEASPCADTQSAQGQPHEEHYFAQSLPAQPHEEHDFAQSPPAQWPREPLSHEQRSRRPRQKKPASYSADFEHFWTLYPRKVGKDAAWSVYQRREHEVPSGAAMADILVRHCQSEQWQRDKGQYIPLPATWLNQGRWMDGVDCVLTPAPSEPLMPRMPQSYEVELSAEEIVKARAMRQRLQQERDARRSGSCEARRQ